MDDKGDKVVRLVEQNCCHNCPSPTLWDSLRRICTAHQGLFWIGYDCIGGRCLEVIIRPRQREIDLHQALPQPNQILSYRRSPDAFISRVSVPYFYDYFGESLSAMLLFVHPLDRLCHALPSFRTLDIVHLSFLFRL